MYSRGLLDSEPDMLTIFLYNNVSNFLNSVVCYTQELSKMSKRAPPCLPQWCCLGGEASQR